MHTLPQCVFLPYGSVHQEHSTTTLISNTAKSTTESTDHHSGKGKYAGQVLASLHLATEQKLTQMLQSCGTQVCGTEGLRSIELAGKNDKLQGMPRPCAVCGRPGWPEQAKPGNSTQLNNPVGAPVWCVRLDQDVNRRGRSSARAINIPSE